MDRSLYVPANSKIPGWKIEPNFKPGVLMGSWDEENRNFSKGNHHHNSTHRTDFRNYGHIKPDVIVRRRAEQHNYGMPAELLLHHHGKKFLDNLVTWYDEDYNGRWREKDLPPLRKFDRHYLTWRPEKSDYNVQEPPTNFGLLPRMQRDWAAQLANEERGDYLTTYSINYTPKALPSPRLCPRYATGKLESSVIHPVTSTLKDLQLRSAALIKAPELMPAEMTYVSY